MESETIRIPCKSSRPVLKNQRIVINVTLISMVEFNEFCGINCGSLREIHGELLSLRKWGVLNWLNKLAQI